MKTFFKTLLGVAVSLVVVFALLLAVEQFSQSVYPMPHAAKENFEVMCAHVAEYPHWVLAAVVPMWSGIAFLGTWIARRLGNSVSGWIVGLLLLAGLGGNVAMLPYRIWFRIVMLIAIPAAIVVGYRLAKPKALLDSKTADANH